MRKRKPTLKVAVIFGAIRNLGGSERRMLEISDSLGRHAEVAYFSFGETTLTGSGSEVRIGKVAGLCHVREILSHHDAVLGCGYRASLAALAMQWTIPGRRSKVIHLQTGLDEAVSPKARLLRKLILKQCDLVIANSEAAYNYVERLTDSSAKVIHLPSSISCNWNANRRKSRQDEWKRYLIVANQRAEKNLESTFGILVRLLVGRKDVELSIYTNKDSVSPNLDKLRNVMGSKLSVILGHSFGIVPGNPQHGVAHATRALNQYRW